jgi:hypothetical protein
MKLLHERDPDLSGSLSLNTAYDFHEAGESKRLNPVDG